MSRVVVQSDKWGPSLLAVILSSARVVMTVVLSCVAMSWRGLWWAMGNDELLVTYLVGRRSTVKLRRLQLVLMGCCWMSQMSGGVPGPQGYVAGQSGVGFSVLMSPFLMCVIGYSFPNEWISLVRMGSFYSIHLLSSLLCHWLVGRAGRRGFLKVVPLAGGCFLCSWK